MKKKFCLLVTGQKESWIFFILIFFPMWAVSRDCERSHGYIWNLRNLRYNVTDNCDEECGWRQCGDVCIKLENFCYCGGQRQDLYSGAYYCCVDHATDNGRQCIVDRYGHGSCPQGSVVRTKDFCNNHCLNDYETSAAVGRRSRYNCGVGCAWTGPLCRGYPLCRDLRDLSECDQNLTCALPSEHNKRTLETDLTDSHYYCVYEEDHNDGRYHTITREDESDLNILSIRDQINYSSITECKTGNNVPGLMCGERCEVHRAWCRKDKALSCGNFSTTNNQLCADTIFWNGTTCDLFLTTGVKVALGRRCTGAIQHCIYPWYTSSIPIYEVSISYRE